MEIICVLYIKGGEFDDVGLVKVEWEGIRIDIVVMLEF